MSRVPVADHIVISAVRYTLGRQTYLTPAVAQEVARVWPELSPNTQALIRREIAEALPRCSDIDRPWWEDVLRLGEQCAKTVRRGPYEGQRCTLRTSHGGECA